jgi:lysozyme
MSDGPQTLGTENNMATLKDQLILHEDLRLKPYVDTVGKVTIGVGRNLDDKGISKVTALQMLDEDIEECWKDMKTFPWFDGLDDIRKRVLLDMRFNLGPSRFRKFKNMLKHLEKGEFDDVAEHMLDSLWAKQTKTRAIRLARMMITGKDYDA